MTPILWLEDGSISVDPPKKPKKITGTRFAAIFGMNRWNSPFKTWCEITRVYEEPFEDTKYTRAGKTIEPKQAQFIKDNYFIDMLTPSSVYGEDYFNKTHGDFFGHVARFGGMWDYLGKDENGVVDTVFEMKTTKRSEDWATDIPEYYALQAALYAYLLDVDQVAMVVSFLEDPDYDNPDAYKVTSANTAVKMFRVSERYPDFEKIVENASKWWDDHVLTGISPVPTDEDKDILKVLKTNTLNPDTNIAVVCAEAELLMKELDEKKAEVKGSEKRLSVLKDIIKQYALKNMRPGDKAVKVGGWKLDTISRKEVDKDAMKRDGILEKYIKTKEEYRLSFNPKEVQNGSPDSTPRGE